ncbi:MAG TPA: hypothetical protein GXX45_28540 [Pseudomonas aeruginosa]|nr:hypothetical protein [Pseudomonas aeruginosa]
MKRLKKDEDAWSRQDYQMKLEAWLRSAMAKEAEGIHVDPNFAQRIKANLPVHRGIGQGKGKIVFARWRKAAFATVSAVLIIISLIFSLSPEARAWAEKEVISPVLSVAYKVIRTEEGYRVKKLDHPGSDGVRFGGFEEVEAGKAKRIPEFSTAAEAQAFVGFSFHLPAYLPSGYERISMTGDRQEGSDRGFVSVIYGVPREKSKKLHLTISNERNIFRGDDTTQEVKVQGKTAYWKEVPVMEINPTSMEPTVKIRRTLTWEDGGVVYKLEDRSGSLPLKDMLRVAESLR